MLEHGASVTVRIFGDEDGAVDADVLAKILQGMQRAVYITAMDANNIESASSGYIPQGIQKTFIVRCLIPQQGSYALPLTIGSKDDLTAPEAAGEVVDKVLACLRALVCGDSDIYQKNIRNRKHRVYLLDAFRTMLPKPGATWKLGISRLQSDEITLTADSVRHLSNLKENLRQQQPVPQTITGSLQAMDFKAHKITILYPENNRELECFYDEELEPELWETRRDLVQVTGTVVVDAQSLPIKIQDVEMIQPLDLSDFDIREVLWGPRALKFKSVLVLKPELTESKQYMVLRDDALDIDVIAPTREELLTELNEQVCMLWSEYALESDAQLSPAALELKSRLLDKIEEVSGT